jgi:hypothetical protein
MSSIPIPLIATYFLWHYFLAHQTSHVAYASQGHGSMPSFLPYFGVTAKVLGIAFLVYFGFVSHWFNPLILYALGYVGQLALKLLEIQLGLHKYAWAISLIGVVVLPILLSCMFYIAANLH